MSARRAALVLLAALSASGCRALGVAPTRPEPVASVPSLAVTELVDRHNRNAELVRSLEATPGVSMNGRRGGAASGKMALVRPHDFKLTLSSTVRGQLANLGSNDQEFWIWSANSPEKEFFVGKYGDDGEIPPGLLFQPDWITEALGLRVIPKDEAGKITTQDGDAPGTIVLVHHRVDAQGRTTVKKTVVDRQTGEIREHDFFAPDGKTVVARALPSAYQRVGLPGAGADGTGSVLIPSRLVLKATPPGQEEVVMQISLNSVKLNQFPDDQRSHVFALPDFPGYVRRDIEGMPSTERAATTVRETMPAPPAGAGRVRLGAPMSSGRDAAAQRASDPAPLAADLPSGGVMEPVVGARIPRPPGSSNEPDAVGLAGSGLELSPRPGH